jgi:hypothetical protein
MRLQLHQLLLLWHLHLHLVLLLRYLHLLLLSKCARIHS